MKTFILAAALCVGGFAANAQQEVRDASGTIKGYINKDGSVHNASHVTVCRFLQDGRILSPTSTVLGYIVRDYELQDAAHVTKGYIHNTGIVEDEHHNLIGKIRVEGDGPVKDNNDNVIGYIDGTEPMWAAAYFFLLHY